MEQGTSTKWIETQAKITELREENDALRIAYPAFLSNVHNFPALCANLHCVQIYLTPANISHNVYGQIAVLAPLIFRIWGSPMTALLNHGLVAVD